MRFGEASKVLCTGGKQDDITCAACLHPHAALVAGVVLSWRRGGRMDNGARQCEMTPRAYREAYEVAAGRPKEVDDLVKPLLDRSWDPKGNGQHKPTATAGAGELACFCDALHFGCPILAHSAVRVPFHDPWHRL